MDTIALTSPTGDSRRTPARRTGRSDKTLGVSARRHVRQADTPRVAAAREYA